VKDTGNGNLDLVGLKRPQGRYTANLQFQKTQKDLPIQLLTTSQPLQATLLLASFGTSKPLSSHVFDLEMKVDPNVSLPKYEKPLRYGKLAEIHHIFRPDPTSGPKIISLFFVLAVLATVPILLGSVCCHHPECFKDSLLTKSSGHISEPTFPTSQKQHPPRLSRTAYSSARLCLWKASSSSTTTSGVCSRHCLLLGSLA
jgi:hypothetical protein